MPANFPLPLCDYLCHEIPLASYAYINQDTQDVHTREFRIHARLVYARVVKIWRIWLLYTNTTHNASCFLLDRWCTRLPRSNQSDVQSQLATSRVTQRMTHRPRFPPCLPSCPFRFLHLVVSIDVLSSHRYSRCILYYFLVSSSLCRKRVGVVQTTGGRPGPTRTHSTAPQTRTRTRTGTQPGMWTEMWRREVQTGGRARCLCGRSRMRTSSSRIHSCRPPWGAARGTRTAKRKHRASRRSHVSLTYASRYLNCLPLRCPPKHPTNGRQFSVNTTNVISSIMHINLIYVHISAYQSLSFPLRFQGREDQPHPSEAFSSTHRQLSR